MSTKTDYSQDKVFFNFVFGIYIFFSFFFELLLTKKIVLNQGSEAEIEIPQYIYIHVIYLFSLWECITPFNQARRKCGVERLKKSLRGLLPLEEKKAEAWAEKVAHRIVAAPAESRFYTIPYGLSLSLFALSPYKGKYHASNLSCLFISLKTRGRKIIYG